ncbi:MAG: PIN domain-containing protein, partial [Deltaproteobacteria bacterium]|nr:PIN domain-containing protein [Deltaproteobacteria bacterium]
SARKNGGTRVLHNRLFVPLNRVAAFPAKAARRFSTLRKRDMMLDAGTTMISLVAEDMAAVIKAAQRFNLDFDDAYQYATAEKYGLTLVSFDGDFDRTERGRKSPAQILHG